MRWRAIKATWLLPNRRIGDHCVVVRIRALFVFAKCNACAAPHPEVASASTCVASILLMYLFKDSHVFKINMSTGGAAASLVSVWLSFQISALATSERQT